MLLPVLPKCRLLEKFVLEKKIRNEKISLFTCLCFIWLYKYVGTLLSVD